jgi:signal transduction histidine kinase
MKADEVYMEFEDNGIGIGREYINKVFDMFFRATNNNEGAGLGLYIVREAIDKLDGKITIESELRKGTTFKIKIPNHYNKQNPKIQPKEETQSPSNEKVLMKQVH